MPLFENIFQPKTKKLLELRKPSDNPALSEWQERAIRTLIKHLTKASAVDDLEKAITEENTLSKCITIPSLLAQDQTLMDARGNPTPPQLIACQFWRWPTLQTVHELRHTQFCEVGLAVSNSSASSQTASQLICINPFHYDKITSPKLPPVMVPKINIAGFDAMGTRGTDMSTNSLSSMTCCY